MCHLRHLPPTTDDGMRLPALSSASWACCGLPRRSVPSVCGPDCSLQPRPSCGRVVHSGTRGIFQSAFFICHGAGAGSTRAKLHRGSPRRHRYCPQPRARGRRQTARAAYFGKAGMPAKAGTTTSDGAITKQRIVFWFTVLTLSSLTMIVGNKAVRCSRSRPLCVLLRVRKSKRELKSCRERTQRHH